MIQGQTRRRFLAGTGGALGAAALWPAGSAEAAGDAGAGAWPCRAVGRRV